MKRIIIEILIITLFASFVILQKFNQVPAKLSLDEVEFARLALSLRDAPYTPYSQLATGHATLYFYVVLLSLTLFGINNFALRFPSAFFAIADVILFYFLARLIFKKNSTPKFIPLPFLLSIFLVSMRWYFSFARFSFEVTFLVFIELFSILFILLFRDKRKFVFLAASAVFSGLAFNSYYPGRIFFILPLLALFFHTPAKTRIANLGVFIGIFMLLIIPLSFYLFSTKDIRFKQQFFFSNNTLSVPKRLAYLGINTLKLNLMFALTGDLNGRHNYPGKPILNPVLGAFFLFGFFVAILNLKNFYNQFFLIFLILSLIPAALTYPWENPNILRSFTAIVPTIYFIGYGLLRLFQSASNLQLGYLTILFIAIISLFAFSFFYDQRTYFTYQPTVFRQSFEFPGGLRRILSLKLWQGTHFY